MIRRAVNIERLHAANRARLLRSASRFAVALLGLLACGAIAAAAPADATLLDGLRSRRLFELAERHCEQTLADPKLSAERRADLTIEWSRTLAQHALEVPADKAAPLWRECQGVVAHFAAEHPHDPRLILVRLQGLLGRGVESEAARQAAENSADPQVTEAARTLLRQTLSDLRKLSEELSAELRKAGGSSRHEGGLSAAQLASLELHVRYETARALRNQALCYPAGSADRTNSLTQAIESLAPVIRLDQRTPLVWSAMAEEITCWRLLGDFRETAAKLAAAEKEQPSPGFRNRLRAERIRLALAQREIDEALAEAGSSERQSGSAEVDLARLETLLAARDRASQQQPPEDPAPWERRVLDEVRSIEQAHSGQWLRQAEALLARDPLSGSEGQSAEALSRAAAGLYRGGKIDESLARYDEAAKLATIEQHADQAFDWALTAASIENERSHFRQAIDRYRSLAMKSPQHAKAAEAHLLAVHGAAQLAQAQIPPQLDEYAALLREHVATWPQGATAAQAWCWLGRFEEHQQAWAEAIGALDHVPPGDPLFDQAVESTARCYLGWLAQMHAQGQNGERLSNDALAFCERVLKRAERGKPTAATRAATLAAAQIWLTEISTGAMPAGRLLQSALKNEAGAPAAWKGSARALLAAALAAQGKRDAAAEAFNQIPRGTAAETIVLFQLFGGLRERARSDARQSLAEMQLALSDELLAAESGLDASARSVVERQRTMALADAGRRAEAITAMNKLAEHNPRDGQTQEDLATLLMQGGTADQKLSLEKWREIATKTRAATPRWFRAQLGIANSLHRLGNTEEAKATLRTVRARHPELGGAALRPQFEALEAKLSQPVEPSNNER